MLVEFTVKNFRSIKSEQTLSLAKSRSKELADSNSFDPKVPSSVPLLRSSAIYGPNAAGKSNLIKALKTMRSIVLESATKIQQGDELPVTPFLFDENSSNDATEFEVIFINDGVRYQYGFAAIKEVIMEEWLLAYPKGRAQKWFSRVYNQEEKLSSFEIGNFLTGQKTTWQNATRSNSLFLSTAIQLNSEQLKPVYNWFKQKLKITDNARGWTPSFTASLCNEEPTRKRIIDFLKTADLNIHDINVKKEKFYLKYIPDEMPVEMKEKIINNLKDSFSLEIKTIHKTTNDKLVELEFDEESDGTQKLFSFAGPWIDTLENGCILVIDELHDNLHPKLVKYLIELFHNSKTNPNNAQLIFTTHETSILNQDVFRRDQVWFCDKDDEQATKLYPLTDFSPRKERENLESGYLSGRYGAIPFVNDITTRK